MLRHQSSCLSCLLYILFYSYLPHPDLHSFPTRRSSDLADRSADAMNAKRIERIIVANHGFDDGGGEEAEHSTQRSEEHTSELQSQFHLVCRLLLEKKKKKNKNIEIIKKHNKIQECISQI